MVRVAPNSHRWTDLKQLITHFELNDLYISHTNTKKLDSMYEPLTIKYLLISFENVKKDGIKLVFNGDINKVKNNISTIFTSIDAIIDYLNYYVDETNPKLEEWSLDRFREFIKITLKCGFNLKKMNIMEKNEVYERVDGELKYQDKRWVVRRDANDTPDESKPPAEWINYMQHHVNKANTAVYNLDDKEALAQIRKVVALGVRALMIHGCPEREIPDELLKE